jgi:serine/threonine-protein phosphatase 2A regulatory subunit A
MKRDLLQTLSYVCKDPSESVRISLATNFCTPDVCSVDMFIKFCIPATLQLLRDDSVFVRIKVLGAMPCMAEYISVETFQLTILPSLRDILVDKSWRIRKNLVELLPDIIDISSSANSIADVLEWIEKLLFDPVFCVREASGRALAEICAKQGVSFTLETGWPILRSVMRSNNYLHRITGLQAAKHVAMSLNSAEINAVLMETMRQASGDDVPNVRLSSIRTASELLSAEITNSESIFSILKHMDEDTDADVRGSARRCLMIR